VNQSQTASAIRWFITAFGAGIAGWIAGKGWASANDVLGVLSSDTFIQAVGAIVTVVPLAWGLFRHREQGVAAAADSMPNVAGVITKDTPAGEKLAKAVPSPTVTVAGSAKAATIAKAR
jgi:hypothetical protein